MSATEVLRRMLDERGVEYRFNEITKVFEWHFEGTDGEGSAHATEVNGGINIIACSLTPEQAVAATLGDAPRLPHWWTHDGTLHVELPKLPDSISVRLPAQREREVGSARVWQYTRDSGTCHECAGMDDVFECSACGGRYEGWALKRWARYCPDCGRRIEVDA